MADDGVGHEVGRGDLGGVRLAGQRHDRAPWQGVVDGGDDGLLAGCAAVAEQQHGRGVDVPVRRRVELQARDGAELPTDRGHGGQAGVPARLTPHGGHVVGRHSDGPAVEVLERGVVVSGGDEVVDPVQHLRLGGQDGAVTGFVEEQLLDVRGEQRRAEGADGAVGVAVEGHCPTVGPRDLIDDRGDVGVFEADVVDHGVIAAAASTAVHRVHRVVRFEQRGQLRQDGGVGAGPVNEHQRGSGPAGAVRDAGVVDRLDV
jgi:hypothetical protein